MKRTVFFLEEKSAEELLKGLLRQLFKDDINAQFIVFEGKQDLEKNIERKLRAWQDPSATFFVLRDQDSGDCLAIKTLLMEKCRKAGKLGVIVRIACRELESFYLGDLAAVSKALGPPQLSNQQKKAKYRDPDQIQNPAKELKRICPNYQKIAGSRKIASHLRLDSNSSKSFQTLLLSLRNLSTSEKDS